MKTTPLRSSLVSLFVIAVTLGVAGSASANDGDLDTTWGSSGLVYLGLSDYDFVVDVSPFGSDDVQVLGNIDSTGSGGPYDSAVVSRYNSDGSLDSGCGGTGSVTFTTPDTFEASDMVVLGDGSTIVVGTDLSTPVRGLAIKYTPACQLDTTFGSAGVFSYTDRLGVSFSSIAVQSDNSLVIGGLTNFAQADGGNTRFTVVRVTPNGSLDPTFGPTNTGVFVSDNTHQGRVSDVLVDSTGRVVFAGVQNGSSDDDAVIARLSPSGVIDTTYASSGWFTRGGADDQWLSSIALRSNDGVVSVGVDIVPTLQGTLICLNVQGNVDASCGVSGALTQVPLPFGAFESRLWSVVVDDMGRYVISGIFDDPTASGSGVTPIVIRLLANGSADSTFGSGALVIAPFTPGHATKVAIDQQGRLLVGGHEFAPNAIVGPIVRLTASTTTSTTTSTISPQLLPATGSNGSNSWPVIVMGLGLGLLLVRRFAIGHSAK